MRCDDGAYNLLAEILVVCSIAPRAGFRRGYMRRRPRLSHVLLISLALWILIASLSYTSADGASAKTPTTPVGGYAYSGNNISSPNAGVGGSHSGPGVVDVYDARSVYRIINSSGGPFMLYFEQEDCPGCKEIWPAIEKLVGEKLPLTLVRIHIDKIFYSDMEGALKLAESFKVPGTPTLIIMRNGSEVARHVGIFRGDQYEGLRAFVQNALSASGGPGVPGGSVAWYLQPLSLGLLAALSPCSLPMMALFSTSARAKAAGSLKILATLIVLLVPAAAGLGILSSTGRVGGVSPYYAITTYLGVLVIVWGALTLIDMEPLASLRLGRASLALPILGMQCSFPFVLATISLYSRDPVGALVSALLFSLGYSAPYATLSTLFSAISRGAGGKRSGKALRLAQALALMASGAYLLITGAPNIF